MKVQTFIFAHKQEIILDYINSSKFKFLPNVTYLLLGSGDCSQLIDKRNVIVARNLDINREEYPLFVSYTGWYALCKNNLIDDDTDYVNLFEYDINLSINFDEVLFQELRKRPDAVVYTYYSIISELFLMKEWSLKLNEVTKRLYNIDIYNYYENLSDKDNYFWTNSTNVTLSRDLFLEFISWFENYFLDLYKSNFPGHEYERSITLFFHFKNKKLIFLRGLINHIMANSHGMTHISGTLQYKDVRNKLLKI